MIKYLGKPRRKFIGSKPLSIMRLQEAAAQLDYEAVELRIWLQVLPDIERTILEDLYVYDLSQRETAQLLHISQMQVSRLHRHALETLRRELP
ncbi:MAG: sigma-70 family RNA polymerase sigma factor [Bacilli bacterium]